MWNLISGYYCEVKTVPPNARNLQLPPSYLLNNHKNFLGAAKCETKTCVFGTWEQYNIYLNREIALSSVCMVCMLSLPIFGKEVARRSDFFFIITERCKAYLRGLHYKTCLGDKTFLLNEKNPLQLPLTWKKYIYVYVYNQAYGNENGQLVTL